MIRTFLALEDPGGFAFERYSLAQELPGSTEKDKDRQWYD